MKVALVFVVVAVSIALTSAALTCWGDKNKCSEKECCVQIGTMFAGTCKKLTEEDKKCQVKQGKVFMKDHVYLLSCPCADGLECVPKEGVIGKMIGTCQQGSGEQPEPEEE